MTSSRKQPNKYSSSFLVVRHEAKTTTGSLLTTNFATDVGVVMEL